MRIGCISCFHFRQFRKGFVSVLTPCHRTKTKIPIGTPPPSGPNATALKGRRSAGVRSIGGFVWDNRGGVARPSCPAPLRPMWSSHKSVLLPLQGPRPAIRALPPPPSPRPPSGPVGPLPVVLDIVELALSLAMGTAMPRHLWGHTPPIPANPPDFFNFL